MSTGSITGVSTHREGARRSVRRDHLAQVCRTRRDFLVCHTLGVQGDDKVLFFRPPPSALGVGLGDLM